MSETVEQAAAKHIKSMLEGYADGYRSAAEAHFNPDNPNPPDGLVSREELQAVSRAYAKRLYAELPFGTLLYQLELAAGRVYNRQYGR